MDKEYQTKDGRKVRIICVDGPRWQSPVIGVKEGYGDIDMWTEDGKFNSSGNESPWDLVEVPKTVTRWVNIYEDGGIMWMGYTSNTTRQMADSEACRNHSCRIGCKKIKIAEGEFDDE